ncbi:MAG: hypothetical protein ACTHM6_16270 [Tepidisphaeraceae bacterium]
MDAPEFDIPPTPIDSSDALQLDPSDSLAGFEIAPAAPKPAPRPAKKPSLTDNDAVVAALLGKPLAKSPLPPAPSADEIPNPAKPVSEASILSAMLGKPVMAAPSSRSVNTPYTAADAVASASPSEAAADVAPQSPSPALAAEEVESPESVADVAVPQASAPEITAPEIAAFDEAYVIPDPPIDLPPLRLTYSEADEPAEEADEALELDADLPPRTLKLPIPFTPAPAEDEATDVADEIAAESVAVEPVAVEREPIAVAQDEVGAGSEVAAARVAEPIDIAPHLEAAFAIGGAAAGDVAAELDADVELDASAPMMIAEPPRGPTGAWWTLPLMFAGIAIVACAVLVPATDENRRAMYELAKIDRDVAYFQKQSDVNKDFLQRVSNDPTLAERLALRQLHMTLADTHLVKIPTKAEPFNRSPFALVSVEPPPALEPYRPVAGVLGEWFLDVRRQIYLAGIGLLMAAAGVIFGGGEPAPRDESSTA